MKFLLLLFLLGSCLYLNCAAGEKVDIDKNDFAEFDMEEEDIIISEPIQEATISPKPSQEDSSAVSEADDDEVKVEEEDFDHFQDDEEFEGLSNEKQPLKSKNFEKPDLKITKVPAHLRRHWEHFYIEIVMVIGLAIYCAAFIIGRNKNAQLAQTWFNVHRPLLESNFALVGDDGKKEVENPGLIKESEHIYTLWCSGRVCVEGMLVELRLLKRQDLVSLLACFMKPAFDQIMIRVEMSPDVMDSFVMCLATKKAAARLAKEMQDISTYCPEKKSAEKFGFSSNFTLMNEIGEVATTLLDTKLVSVLKKYEDYLEYIHFSDQYTGSKIQEENQTSGKLPDAKKVLIFSFNAPNLRYGAVSTETMENLKPLLQLVFYCIEKVRKFRLSKEAKNRAEKHRQKVEEAFLKTTHAQRQEAAQLRREERRRAEKERIMNEEDPEKQRKWEEREHRRELKKKAPKLKQMKVKTI